MNTQNPAAAAEQRYCTHEDCRLTTVDELMALNAIGRRPDIILAVYLTLQESATVRCRHVPRKGGIA